jgi:hypothetical protein
MNEEVKFGFQKIEQNEGWVLRKGQWKDKVWCFTTGLVTQILNCTWHLQLIIFIHYEC